MKCIKILLVMKKYQIINVFLIIIMSLTLFSCANKNEKTSINTLEDLEDKRVGIKQGTIYDELTKNLFPNATYYYYNNTADLTAALKGNKIDGFCGDDPAIDEIVRENPEIKKIGKGATGYDVAFVFAKNEKGKELAEKMNVVIQELKDSGELDKLYEKWMNYDANTEIFDNDSLSGENGTIILATQTGAPPFNILLNGEVTGYEIELVALFCQKYGYKLVVNEMYFDGLLPAVQTGKADIAAGGIAITQERSKSVYFSNPHSYIYASFAVLNDEAVSHNFIDKIVSSFNSTFIEENRWRLFIDGIINTLTITILSIVLGTLLGFFAFTNTRNNEGLLLKLVKLSIWVIQGMPTVVLLMVLYYIVFGSVSISSFWVSIIGFTLIFACAVFNMLNGAVKTIDVGQSQAAFTLGFSEKKTFYKIILPQAIRYIMPSYKTEIVSLIKATAIVGYIAVQDLTKIGDQIRSRTYEAFFPLIVVTIIYFILAGLLAYIINKIDFKIDPRKRSHKQILKGVKLNDRD